MIYTCSDAVLDLLEQYWVDTIFWYPGWAIIPFYDKIPHHKNIKHILVRNEQWAWFAAQWYARSTWKLWVCVATSWPGWTNVITAIADAYLDSIPLLFITGQVPSYMIWKDLFQEADMTWITMNITKNNFLIDDPSKVIKVFTEAIKIATTGRPWPVHVDFPKDIQFAPFKKELLKINFSFINKKIDNSFNIIEFLKYLNSSIKPVLLVWHWVWLSWAIDVINKFIDITWIPTVTTLLAKWIINDNENNLWMVWMHWFYHANMAVNDADLIINIWSRFDDRIVWTYDDFWKNAKIIHVDIDKAELNKVVNVDLPINCDAKEFLKELLWNNSLKKLDIDNWKKQIKQNKIKWDYNTKTKYFSMRNVLSSIQNIIDKNPDEYIVVTDVWQHQMWSALNFKIHNPKNWLTSWWAWTMWFWLPSAIWASIANRDKIVILICWDWWIQMNIQEFATIKDNNLNIKVFILNNSFLWMVRQWQDLFYWKNYSSVNITSPDFEIIANWYWLKWCTFKNEIELNKNIDNIILNKWAIVANVFVEQEENVFPMVPAGKSLSETILK